MILNKKDFNQSKYNELINYANKNNLIIVDKGEYYETEKVEEPVKTLEELKKEKIQELKNNCQNYIYLKYPIYKQINAANGLATEEEISQMITFIQKARLICEEKEQQINSVKTQNELEKISTNFYQK